MFDLLFENACLPDGSIRNIAVAEGRIAAVNQEKGQAAKWTVDLKGKVYLSAGWIDGHVHCNPGSLIYFDEPDAVGVTGGVTTIVDAGSTGADDIDAFRRLAEQSKTNVRALLNISRIGLATQHELANLDDIDMPLAGRMICRHCGFVVGIKARMSGSVIGDNGLKPLKMAKEIQRQNNSIPLMVHFGNKPPMVDGILDLLGKGDILTHCFHGKPNGILTSDGHLREATGRALERGLLLDVGHGSASFSFKVAEHALADGIFPHTISSDIYCKNRVNGPVYGLAQVMSKFLMLGMSLPKVIASVTAHAADMFAMSSKGRLEVGKDADLTLFILSDTPQTVSDSEGESRTSRHNLVPLAAVVAGAIIPTKQGQEYHDLNL